MGLCCSLCLLLLLLLFCIVRFFITCAACGVVADELNAALVGAHLGKCARVESGDEVDFVVGFSALP